MNIYDVFPSKYVRASDLAGRTVTVTIDRLALEEVGAPPKTERKPVLYFRRATKGLVLNRTNGMALAALYGPETDNWIGKTVQLYVAQVRAFGSVQDAIRLRAAVQPAPTPTEQVTVDDAEDALDHDDHELWEVQQHA